MMAERLHRLPAARLSAAVLVCSAATMVGCGAETTGPPQTPPAIVEQTPSPEQEPAPGPEPASNCEDLQNRGFTTQVIQPGDTLSSISRTALINLTALQEYNIRSGAVTDPGVIKAGGCVTLPISSVEPISDEMFARMQGLSWREGCIGRDSLRLVRVPYLNLQGQAAMGAIVVNEQIAADIGRIFEKIIAAGTFGFENVAPVEEVPGIETFRYGDPVVMDEHVMAANYTTGFACRPIEGTDVMSEHSKGTAIDVNPRTNPMLFADGTVSPSSGAPYLDRNPQTPGLLSDQGGPGQAVINIFKDHGYNWGGDWQSPKDWQHFELA